MKDRLPHSLPARGDVNGLTFVPLTPALVRGWLHDRPAIDLIEACMSWLGGESFAFPQLWWQTNSQCPDQLAACDELGLTRVLSVQVENRTWEMRA